MEISLDEVKELALENWILRRENAELRARLKAAVDGSGVALAEEGPAASN